MCQAAPTLFAYGTRRSGLDGETYAKNECWPGSSSRPSRRVGGFSEGQCRFLYGGGAGTRIQPRWPQLRQAPVLLPVTWLHLDEFLTSRAPQSVSDLGV